MTDDENKLRADILTEFLEVAFHSILYVRNLYPRQIFQLRKKYQIPVHVSRHPKINEYLNGCLKTIRRLLTTDSVKHVFLNILRDEKVVERFVFDVQSRVGDQRDEFLVATEELFRQYLLRLAVIDATLPELPEDSTFAIYVTTNERCYVRMNEFPESSEFPWIEAEDLRNTSLRIFPIKSAEGPLFAMNVYVER